MSTQAQAQVNGVNGTAGVHVDAPGAVGKEPAAAAGKPEVNGTNGEEAKTWEERYQAAHASIKQTDIDHWHAHGYVLIPHFLTPSELRACRAGIDLHMPSYEEYSRRYPMFGTLWSGGAAKTAPGWVRYDFPFASDALNSISTHPFLVAFAERLHGHGNFSMSHSALVGKYAGKADYDQQLHRDYSNNTLVIPQRGTKAFDLPMIVYYTDVTLDLGPTYVVPAEYTQHLPPTGQRHYSKEAHPEIYAHERPALVPAGSVLIYSMRTFHRGSRMLAKEGCRFNHFLAYHTRGVPWLGSHRYTAQGGSKEMDRFVTRATPREREIVGFPAVGDEYWEDEECRRGVGERYPEMDMTPYGGRD